jgi:DNA-binding NarL/FixJ family response regulator
MESSFNRAQFNLIMITVLIISDQFLTQVGLSASLETENDIRLAAAAETAEQAAKDVAARRPSVTLVDLDLPGTSGFEAISSVIAVDPAAHVLAFSTFARADEIRAALEAGARGYLKKSSTRKELILGIRTVAAGNTFLPQNLSKVLIELQACSTITPREREILFQISTGSSNRVIGRALGIAEDTVKQYVSRILKKLGVNDRAQAATESIRRGIIRLF